jgi:hypothetical protein
VGVDPPRLKPADIPLDRNNFVCLIDFMIARAAGDSRITKAGSTIGGFALSPPNVAIREPKRMCGIKP